MLYVGSISAFADGMSIARVWACLGEAVILSTGTPIPARWACRRDRADIELAPGSDRMLWMSGSTTVALLCEGWISGISLASIT